MLGEVQLVAPLPDVCGDPVPLPQRTDRARTRRGPVGTPRSAWLGPWPQQSPATQPGWSETSSSQSCRRLIDFDKHGQCCRLRFAGASLPVARAGSSGWRPCGVGRRPSVASRGRRRPEDPTSPGSRSPARLPPDVQRAPTVDGTTDHRGSTRSVVPARRASHPRSAPFGALTTWLLPPERRPPCPHHRPSTSSTITSSKRTTTRGRSHGAGLCRGGPGPPARRGPGAVKAVCRGSGSAPTWCASGGPRRRDSTSRQLHLPPRRWVQALRGHHPHRPFARPLGRPPIRRRSSGRLASAPRGAGTTTTTTRAAATGLALQVRCTSPAPSRYVTDTGPRVTVRPMRTGQGRQVDQDRRVVAATSTSPYGRAGADVDPLPAGRAAALDGQRPARPTTRTPRPCRSTSSAPTSGTSSSGRSRSASS